MKTYLSIAILACCSFAAFAFAQKPEGANKLADLLPVGTHVSLVEHSDAFTVHVLGKDAALVGSSPNVISDIKKYAEEEFEKGEREPKTIAGKVLGMLSDLEREEQRRFDRLVAEVELSKTEVYEVTKTEVDHIILKPKKSNRDVTWVALPYTSIKQITCSETVSSE